MERIWLATGAAACLAALVAAPFIYAPGAGSTAEPSLEEGLQLTQRVVRTVDVPLPRFHAWLDRAPLQDIVPGSAMIPRVTATEPVSGNWGEPGAVRRVRLADGSSALETIVARHPPYYSTYKVWPEGGAGRRLVRYIQGEFHLSAVGNRTQVEWRYAIRPRSSLGAIHALLFSQLAIRPFLDAGIDRIKSAAEADHRG